VNQEELLDLMYRCFSHFSDGRPDVFYPATWEIDRFAELLKRRRSELPEPRIELVED
jgi:hypothetical protein